MRGQNFLPATASPADSARSILILRGNFETDQHLYLALLFHKDYFARSDASLSCSFVPQGLFRPGRMHLYLALLLHRDYFHRSDASLSGSFAPQGLFSPVRCISTLLFCSTGIISTGQMHLYQAFLLHRDYFDRPDASLSGFFAPQGLFPPARLRYCRNSSYSFSCFISIFPRHRSGTLPWKIRFLFPGCLLDRPFKIFLCDKIRKTNDRYPPEVFFVCIVKF